MGVPPPASRPCAVDADDSPRCSRRYARTPCTRAGGLATPRERSGHGGAICWVEPDGLPRLRKLSLNGVPIDGPRALADELRRPGPVSTKRARHIANLLDRRLPPRI